MMDDIEIIGKLRGVMASDLMLLREALAAAKKGKTDVVIDHLERVISSQVAALVATAWKN